MSAKFDDRRRLKLAAQGLRKTAISLQAAVVSLLQTADALTAETDDNLVENNPLDVNLQDFLKGDINSTLIKLLNDALNNYGEALDDDQRAKQNGKRANGLKKTTRRPKPPRDPNAPVKPQNAFILYQKDIANQVKAEHEGKPWSEIVHLISIRWRNLPKEEKDVYELKFKEAKRLYEAENKIYMENKDQDQAATAADPEGHEDNNNDTSESVTPDSQSTASQSEEEEEDDDDMPNPSVSRSSRSKVKSSASTKNTTYSNPESSSKKKSRKRKPQDDDDDESNHEEEEHYELPKKSKKKASNEEGGEVQGKGPKKIKKSSREEDKDLDIEGKSKKKKSKKNKQD